MTIKCYDGYCSDVKGHCCRECNERNIKDCCCPLAKKYEFNSEEILDRCGCAVED